MNVKSVLLWGFAATLALTTLSSGSRGLGVSRMDLPFMLGTMVTPNRDRAKAYGFFMHFMNGWILASIYALYFEAWKRATWWLGTGLGFVHALFVLVTLLPFLPAFHPRMVSDYAGPEPTRQLEPPGFLALNYGRGTPLATTIAHLVYGGILGTFYRFLP